MSRVIPTAVAVLALLGPAGAQPTWEIDPAHSAIQFSVRHLMISNVRGEFGRFTGTVTGDTAKAPAAVVKASIEAASIDTREPKRDAHLKSPDFLDVERHPTITFVSKTIESAGAGRWKGRARPRARWWRRTWSGRCWSRPNCCRSFAGGRAGS